MPAVVLPEVFPMDGSVKLLQDLPALDWCYGCMPTATAMIMGYYDRREYPNLYTAPSPPAPPSRL
jgi:hypothetical protein